MPRDWLAAPTYLRGRIETVAEGMPQGRQRSSCYGTDP